MPIQTWEENEPGREAEGLFPRFVCRVSGAPADGVERMRALRTLALLDEAAAADEALAGRREEVSAVLFAAIGAAGDDREARNPLLKARRELFNLRPMQPAALEAACAHLPAAGAEAVRAFQGALEGREALARRAAEAHARDSADARAAFRGLVRDEDFRKGLLISSRSLAASLDRYSAGSGTLSGKDEKTERGLLRYYTRMAMKATPFATFCAVVPGRFVAAEGAGPAAGAPMLRVNGTVRGKRSFVRINKLLYGLLLDHLKTRPTVRRRLVVEPNPTLRTAAGRLVFLTTIQGREVFQRLAPNEVLQLIGGVMGSEVAPTLGDLIGRLVANPEIDATAEEAEAYLDKLIEIGFLRFRTGIREQDADWDQPFAALLDGIDDEHAARSAALLRVVRERTDAYAAAAVEAREGIIAGILAEIEAAFDAMEIKGRIRKDMPFYEDATAAADAEVSLTPGVLRAVDTLSEWSRLTSRLGWPRTEQATMRHFYDQFYADAGGPVPLLVFYEDFYREHFKAHVEKEQKARAGLDRDSWKDYDLGNPFALPFVKAVADARTRLQDCILERWRAAPDAEEIVVPMADVEAALAGVEPQAVPCRSVSAFALLAPPAAEGGDPAFLLQGGSYTAGYGKYFSRFLYMLPDEFVAEVRAANESLTGELLAEICGDAQFNANLHPPLLRWEISYPTGESGAADEQLRSSDLFVERDAHDPHSLALRHAPTGQRVVPVDLGFLNPRMRPPLYQLLSRFTPPVTFAPSVPESTAPPAAAPKDEPAAGAPAPEAGPDTAAADAEAAPGAEAPEPAPAPRIVHRPRISVDGRLVLSRRRWLVPGPLFPQRQGDESAAAYFARAHRWCRDNGLPESCYLRVIPVPDPAARKPGDAPPVEDAQEAAMNVGGDAVPGADAAPAEAPEAAAGPEAAAPAAEGAKAGEGEPPKKVTTPSRDFYKPQFMDFGNPLLAGLAGKLTGGLKHFNVIVEERLPAPDALARVDDEAYATEMVIQLNFPGSAAGAPADAAQGEAHATVT